MREGNCLFLVCVPCSDKGEADYGCKLASRSRVSFYTHEIPSGQLDAWLSKHRNCGGRHSPDHFKLAHLFAQNHDQELANPVKEAVQLSLVNGSGPVANASER